jgi:hypothetical protein
VGFRSRRKEDYGDAYLIRRPDLQLQLQGDLYRAVSVYSLRRSVAGLMVGLCQPWAGEHRRRPSCPPKGTIPGRFRPVQAKNLLYGQLTWVAKTWLVS